MIKEKGYKTYLINVQGVDIYALYNPKWMVIKKLNFVQAHIEFHSIKEKEPNPISETGYKSHFPVSGYEVDEKDIQSELQQLGNIMALEDKKVRPKPKTLAMGF